MLAIIPARKNSKRLPNKNIKLLLGKPLIAYTIEAALKSKKITRIIVSTDCPKIAKISKKYGAEVPFLRPKEISTDRSGKFEVCQHTINFLAKEEGINISSFIFLQPTSPLRLVKDIDEAIKIFKKKKADSVVSFCRAKSSLWYYSLRKDGVFYTKLKKVSESNQTNINNYLLNGCIFVLRTSFMNKNRSNFMNMGNAYNKKSFSYVMPKERSVDIDDINDFENAKYLIFNKLKNK